MDTQDAPKEATSQTAASTSSLPEAEAYATLIVTQYLVDNKLCSEVTKQLECLMLTMLPDCEQCNGFADSESEVFLACTDTG